MSDEFGKIDCIISIFLGILFGCMIIIFGRFHIKYKGPNSNIVRKQIYNIDGKCYKLTPIVVSCGKN
jgi:hypothetical protein